MGQVPEWAVYVVNEQFGLIRRADRLQKQLNAGKTRQAVIQDYDFRVTATCPPSTSVVIRAGKAWRDATYWAVIGYNVEKPSATIDLATEEIFKDNWPGADELLRLNFTNPYYYKAITLGYDGDWVFYEQYGEDSYEYKYRWLGSGTEVATAAEAEAEIDLILNGGYETDGTGPYSEYQFLLWSFVLRNNGVTGQEGQIMPIDPLNRERSYLYRDMRPGKNFIIA